MLFGFKDGLTTYVCGDDEDKNLFLSFRSRNHEGHSFVETARVTDLDEHFFDQTLRSFSEELVVVEHTNESDQNEFFNKMSIKNLILVDAKYEFNLMNEKYEYILERDENNRIRAEAFARGEMPKNTIGDIIGHDPYDKRTDEEKEKDKLEREERDKDILAKIAAGENHVPILTNVNKADRDAKDLSHIRREQLEDMMEDYDEEEDLVDPEELKAVMDYNEKVIHAKTDEEKEKLKAELNSKLSAKTIALREKSAADVAAAQKANENELFTDILNKAKEEHLNGEHKSGEAMDREITIPAYSSVLSSDIHRNISLINASVTDVKIIDLPLTSIDNNVISLPSGKAPFEIDEKTIVAWQNLKLVSRTSVLGITSTKLSIINSDEDCYVLYCDNTVDDTKTVKAEPVLVRIKLSD